jgi:hypothetical protein
MSASARADGANSEESLGCARVRGLATYFGRGALRPVSLRAKGITYDTGFFHAGGSTRERFDAGLVSRELRIIREDLHCSAVRLTGGSVDRLELAAAHAADAGLEVWVSPFTCDLNTDDLLAFLADTADRAERLRRDGAAVVLLVGSELSLFNQGFLSGERLEDRLSLLTTPDRLRGSLAAVPAQINAFLEQAVSLVRARFAGKLSYASLPFEGVVWTPFDIISTDAGYRSAEIAARFRNDIRAFVAQGRAQGKPVALTEFGCCTYRGAADRGGRGDRIVEWEDGRPARLDDAYTRDEADQARYLRELLDIFNAEDLDAAFVNTFARYDLPHREGPQNDLDMASYGVVKVLEGRTGEAYPDMPWEPKLAFATLAEYYRSR